MYSARCWKLICGQERDQNQIRRVVVAARSSRLVHAERGKTWSLVEVRAFHVFDFPWQRIAGKPARRVGLQPTSSVASSRQPEHSLHSSIFLPAASLPTRIDTTSMHIQLHYLLTYMYTRYARMTMTK